MTIENGLAAQLVLGVARLDGDGLHRGGVGLGDLRQDLLGEVGAFGNIDGAGGDLHGKGHAGGVPAVLAVRFRGELEYIKTFECHIIFLLR